MIVAASLQVKSDPLLKVHPDDSYRAYPELQGRQRFRYTDYEKGIVSFRNGINHSASFAQQSSGNSAGGGGTGSPAGLKADSVHSSQQGTQTSQQGTQNPHGTPTQNEISTQGGSSSASAPSTVGPAPNRTGSSEASQDGSRSAAPGIPSG